MKPLESHTHSVTITEIKWFGRHCVKCISSIDRETGKREVTFKRWVHGRFVVAQKKLMPGYWADIHFADVAFREKLATAFVHMYGDPRTNETL